MKIIIAGCGKIGSTILASLVAEGHEVVAIDTDPDVISEMNNIYDVMGAVGNCADSDVLKEAGIETTSLFVAVTGSDELNMLSCFLARRMGAHHTIARIRKPEYNDDSLDLLKKELHLSMAINPDLMAAKQLYNLLKFPSAVKIETFSNQAFELVEIILKPDSALDGMKLSDMRGKYQAKVLICVVQRGDEVFIPDGNFVLKSGDRVGISAAPAEITKFLRDLGVLQKKAKNVMILGGSRIAYYLATLLTGAGNTVKIIERDPDVAKDLAELLPKARIILGDGAKQELLMEEGLSESDAFVALTGMDEENILMSIFASSQNVPTVISKINRAEMSGLAERLNVDTVVSPRRYTAEALLRYARAVHNSMGSKVETLYQILDGSAEALEFTVSNDPKLVNIPLKDLKIKPNLLIAGILRGRKPIIPGGADIMLPEDRVVVVSAGQKLSDLSDILR